MTESQLLKAVLDYLHVKQVFAWRQNIGGFTGEYKGRKRFVRFGEKGAADIIGILPGGRFLAIECKRKGEPLSPEQFDWMYRISINGGFAFTADDLDVAMERIDLVLGETRFQR